MFAKKTLITLSIGALLAASVPAFAQQRGDGYRSGDRYYSGEGYYPGDGYRSGGYRARDRGFAFRSAAGLTFDQWTAVTPTPDGSMSWAQRLARDNDPNNEFGEGERARLAQARALYESAGGYRY